MAMTLALCPDEELAELERSYLGALETAESYEILGDQMILHSARRRYSLCCRPRTAVGHLVVIGLHWRHPNDPQPPAEGSNFTASIQPPAHAAHGNRDRRDGLQ